MYLTNGRCAEGTPYVGGCFKLKLVLSEEYPNVPPRGFFLTKIYHPNVADNGDICVNTLKRDWSAELTLKHVFQVIKCLMIVPFPESSLNCEAGEHNQSQLSTINNFKLNARCLISIRSSY
jgi:ubiquitin-conjugating enzyme E2 S